MEKAKERIMAIDDNPANLRLLGRILQNEGYEVRMAPNGALALFSARIEPPDLFLLDIRMPGMDGYQLCEKFKVDEKLQDIPVIFVTAFHEPSEKAKAFSLGGVDFITKPFSSEEVLARIRVHLEIRSLQIGLEKKVAELASANDKLREEIERRKKAEERVVNYQKVFRLLLSGFAAILTHGA